MAYCFCNIHGNLMALIITDVASIGHAHLEPYRTLKRPLDHQREGIFVAEGEKVVRRLLMSPLQILSILLTPEWFASYRPLLEARSETINVHIAKKDLMETIVGFQLHKGIMAVAQVPERIRLESVLSAVNRPYFFVAVDGIMNSENMGVIVRNCATFGVNALLIGETSCDPYLRRAVRNSMGNIFTLPMVYLSDIEKELAKIRSEYHVTMIAAHPREASSSIDCIDFSGNCCIVLGSEGHGISEKVLAACDLQAEIPMRIGVDSLNVASASAVIMYEVQRQRTQKAFWNRG
jgi:tRNA G18 (ribose-2'-O)-methylase SpoU